MIILQRARGIGRPRLHWCPTGLFTFLPLHAACASERFGDSCSDYVVSSYTPTLTALLNARRDLVPVRFSERGALLVAEPAAPGLPKLVNAYEEVLLVAKMLSSMTTTIVGEAARGGQGASVAAVHEMLPSATILHLSCHGEQDVKDALQSGFYLRDGKLTIAHLVRSTLPDALFAFLSACETAKGDHVQPDQAIHLAAGVLHAGFRSVVATMW